MCRLQCIMQWIRNRPQGWMAASVRHDEQFIMIGTRVLVSAENDTCQPISAKRGLGDVVFSLLGNPFMCYVSCWGEVIGRALHIKHGFHIKRPLSIGWYPENRVILFQRAFSRLIGCTCTCEHQIQFYSLHEKRHEKSTVICEQTKKSEHLEVTKVKRRQKLKGSSLWRPFSMACYLHSIFSPSSLHPSEKWVHTL